MAGGLEHLKKRIDALERELQAIRAELERAGGGATTETPRPVAVEGKHSSIGDFIRKVFGENAEISIGGMVIGLIGAVALLLGTGWFIKLAIERYWLNESARVLIGLIAGFGAIIAFMRLATMRFRVIPHALAGTGYAICYFALFSAYYFYGLIGLKEAFCFMVAISLVSAFLARRGASQILYLFSLIGAYLAPILMSQGENSYRFLFAYMTLFNLIFLFMSRSFPWKVSAYAVLLLNCAVYAGWMEGRLDESSFLVPFLFITSLLHIFMVRRFFTRHALGRAAITEDILFILAVASHVVLGHLTVAQFYPSLLPHFYLFVCLSLSLWQIVYSRESEGGFAKRSAGVSLLVVVPLMMTAISIFARAPWQVTALVTATGTFSMIALHEDRKEMIVTAIPLWTVTIMVLLLTQRGLPEGAWPLLNSRFYHYLLAALFLAAMLYLRRGEKSFWVYGFLALFLVIVASLIENRDFVTGDLSFRRLSYSYILLFYALALIVPGFRLGKPLLRITGLSLIGIVILKFYAYDMWVLDLVVRIAAGLTLGVFLIVTALFYQKFKEKLVKTMAPTKLLFVLIIAFAAMAVSAEPVRVQSFKYFQDIRADRSPGGDVIYGMIDLDENVYRHSWRYDLRILHRGRELPYILARALDEARSEWKKPKVIFERLTREGRIYVLDLPALPEGAEYARLAVEAAGTYEMNIQVSESPEPGDWNIVGYYFIHRYDDESSRKVIPLGLSGKRYLRLESNRTGALAFPGIEIRSGGAMEFHEKVDLAAIETGAEPDLEGTAYYFPNEKRALVSQVLLRFGDGRFSRSYELFEKDGRHYQSVIEGTFTQREPARQIITLPEPNQNPLKLVVINEDDAPLELKEFAISGPKERLIFELPKEKDVAPLRLYYGNRYARAPRYDIEDTYDRNLKHIALKTGKHTKNGEFGYSMLEPPVSIWIIRILFIGGFAGLVWPTYRIITRYAGSEEKPSNHPGT
ncbi:MAG: DUF2339 domain-containing protein [Spirochaetes bacterium]|nr:DUF2339 domain-containing protein [Spirochaetota bacterium]